MFRRLMERWTAGAKPRAAPAVPTATPPDAQQLLSAGNAALAAGRLEEAARCYAEAAAADPADPHSRVNSGYCAVQQGRFAQALEVLREAAAIDPGLADAHYLQSEALRGLERIDEALAALRRCVSIRPDFPFAWRDLADLYAGLGRFDEALASLDSGLAASPAQPMLLEMRARVLADGGRLEQAAGVTRELLAMHPESAELWSNLGGLLLRLERFDEALSACRRGAGLPGAGAAVHYNLGCCCLAFNDCSGVLEAAAAGLQHDVDNADLQWLQAVAWLLQGDMQQGWPAYEARWSRRAEQVPTRLRAPQPEWDGRRSVDGATVLVYAEQAFGDTIQFLRFLRPLQERGVRVVLRVQRDLLGLARGLDVPGLLVVDQEGPLPAFDLHCSLMSLPWRLGVTLQTIPGGPYLKADASLRAHWEQQLGPHARPRLGIVWSGKPLPDPHRSVPLALLLDHLPSGLQLVSLQKEVRDADRPALQARPDIFQPAEQLRGFAETAALADCMDWIVSIDTSVAHLAGALGKRLDVLLPYVPDWRWMLEREDSPWYPSARLRRQSADRSWEPVLAGLATDLAARVACADPPRTPA